MSGLRRLFALGCILVVAAIGLLSGTAAVRAQAVTDYLSVPGPVVIGGIAHRFAWSSNPFAGYYKHEYIPKGQTLERFERMVLLDLLVSEADVARVAGAQVDTLQARKARDPVANVAIIRNADKGEIIVDFVLSGKAADGDDVIEWNAYRYVPHRDGVLMMGVSRRAYGGDRVAFLKSLKTERPAAIKALAAQPIPAARLKP